MIQQSSSDEAADPSRRDGRADLYQACLETRPAAAFEATCDTFLRSLLAHSEFVSADVWTFDREYEHGLGAGLSRRFSTHGRAPRAIAGEHPLARRIEDDSVAVIEPSEPAHADLNGPDQEPVSFVLYRLADVGFAALSFATESELGMEDLRALREPMDRFATSLDSQLKHSRELSAERRRHQLETEALREQMRHQHSVLASGIAHTFNDLFNVVLGQLELLRNEVGEECVETLERIENTAICGADTCSELSSIAGSPPLGSSLIDLHDLLGDVSIWGEALRPANATLTVARSSESSCTEGSADQLQQLLLNLLMNACEALGPEGGSVEVTDGQSHCNASELADFMLGETLEPGHFAFLEVRDTGEGIEPELLECSFDPFFSKKPGRHGLGLAAVLGIVRGHGGAIRIRSELGQGTAVRVLLPLAA